jgi:hypothetical protein
MSGKGELVDYTRMVEKGPLTPAQKAALKQKISDIIDAATHSITIEAMVESAPDE